MSEHPETALSFDDALRELNVDGNATSDEVRRAYLRLVKTRSPERDPTGFRRARAAYDLVRETLAMRQLAAKARPVQLTEAAAPIIAVESTAPASASPDAPAEAASNPAPRPMPNLSSEQQATLTLVERAWAIRATSDWKLMVEAIEAATRWPSGPPIPVPACVFLMVASIAEEQLAPALELRRALGSWFDARQDAARMLSADVAARWMLAQELCVVAPEITTAAAAAIAKALLAGDLTQARSALTVSTVVLNGPSIGALFQRHAPHLIAALPESSVPRTGAQRTTQGRSRAAWWTIVPMILFGMRALSGMDSCVDGQSTTYTLPPNQRPTAFPIEPSAPLPSDGQFKLAAPRLLGTASDSSTESAFGERAEAVARQADRLGLAELAADARALGEKRQAEGCPSVHPAVTAMKKAVDHARDRGLRAAYRDLSAVAERECGSRHAVDPPHER